MRITEGQLRRIIREALEDPSRPYPQSHTYKIRPPGYEEALLDLKRAHSSIAAEFGFSSATVSNDRKKIGVFLEPGRPGRPPGTTRPAGYVEALRDTSRTLKSISAEFGLSLSAILKDRKALGIVTGREVGPEARDRARIPGYALALQDPSRSVRSIADEFGIDLQLIYNDRFRLQSYQKLKNKIGVSWTDLPGPAAVKKRAMSARGHK